MRGTGRPWRRCCSILRRAVGRTRYNTSTARAKSSPVRGLPASIRGKVVQAPLEHTFGALSTPGLRARPGGRSAFIELAAHDFEAGAYAELHISLMPKGLRRAALRHCRALGASPYLHAYEAATERTPPRDPRPRGIAAFIGERAARAALPTRRAARSPYPAALALAANRTRHRSRVPQTTSYYARSVRNRIHRRCESTVRDKLLREAAPSAVSRSGPARPSCRRSSAASAACSSPGRWCTCRCCRRRRPRRRT